MHGNVASASLAEKGLIESRLDSIRISSGCSTKVHPHVFTDVVGLWLMCIGLSNVSKWPRKAVQSMPDMGSLDS